MASLVQAAAMLPTSAGVCCRKSVCQCATAVRSVQASRTKATAQEACVQLDKELFIQPVQATVSERRPVFHMAPAGGWINDPNGPLLHNGTYHLFYQHVPNSPGWQWGLVWGHAKSKDLINWEHLPVALEPTPNGLDQHGCFSGCATVDVDGRPALLYTGVIRKTPQEIEAEPDLSHQHEAQLIAVATDLDDPDLRHWQKLPGTFLPNPPEDMNLTGWRDPFVLEKPSASSPWWYVMIGAGVHNKCGTALVYRSKDLTEGWQYVGPLCESASSNMWECPIMAHLTNAAPTNRTWQGKQLQRHMFSVSPDYCVNMIQYWLGDYADGKFDMEGACGPHKLDLGDVMYAPNILTDEHGRTVLWAWLQEKQHQRPSGTYTSSCCLCVPRALYLSADGSTLLQEPLPELKQLRQQQQGAWHVGSAASAHGHSSSNSAGVKLSPGQPLQLGAGIAGFSSSSVDMELQVARGDGDSFALVLHAFEGAEGAAGAAITYCWSTRELQVVYSTDLGVLERMAPLPITPRPHYKMPGPDPVQLAAAEAAAAEPGTPLRCGGQLRAAQDAPSGVLSLRILLDGSCLEVFTSTGEALTTRVYRGDEPSMHAHAAHSSFFQDGAEAVLSRCSSPADAAMASAAAAGAVGWEQLFRGGSNGSSFGARAAALAGGQLELVSFGPGPATLLSGSAWQMTSIWQLQQQQQQAVAAAAAAEVMQGLVVAEVAAVAAAATVTPVILPVGELSIDVGVAAAMANAELAGGVAELLPGGLLSPSGVSPVQVPIQA